jgi:hypothetical protein
VSSLARLIASAIALAPSPLYAALSGVPNEAVESQNGQYVLVLLIPASHNQQYEWELRDYDPKVDVGWEPEEIRRYRQSYFHQKAITEKYQVSGLYRTGDAKTPLWKTDWSWDVKDVFVANDGVHHAFAFQEWDSTISNRGNAVEFYARGKLLASYSELELLPAWRLRFLAARYLDLDRPTCTSAWLDDATGTFRIKTNQGDAFEFDIATGKLIRSSSPWSKFTALAIALLIGLAAAGAWSVRRKFTGARPAGTAMPN